MVVPARVLPARGAARNRRVEAGGAEAGEGQQAVIAGQDDGNGAGGEERDAVGGGEQDAPAGGGGAQEEHRDRGARTHSRDRRERSRDRRERSRGRRVPSRDRRVRNRDRRTGSRDRRTRSRDRRTRSRDRRTHSRERRIHSRDRRTRSRDRRTHSRDRRPQGRDRWQGRDRSQGRDRRPRSRDRRGRDWSRSRSGEVSRSRDRGDRREGGREIELEGMRREVEELQRKMSAISASESVSYPPMTKHNHQMQMEFNMSVKGILVNEVKAELARLFPAGAPVNLVEIIKKGESELNKRCKDIALADGSPYGWLTVSEYRGSQLADNESDGKKIEDAERKAARKIELKKKDAEKNKKKGASGEAPRWRGRKSRTTSPRRSPSRGRRRRSRSQPDSKPRYGSLERSLAPREIGSANISVVNSSAVKGVKLDCAGTRDSATCAGNRVISPPTVSRTRSGARVAGGQGGSYNGSMSANVFYE